MPTLSSISPKLLDALQSRAGPLWTALWPELVELDDDACVAIAPLCARFSDKECEVPLACRQALIKGEPAPAALRLCRSLDWTRFFDERTSADPEPEDLFPHLMRLPIWSNITHLVLSEPIRYLPVGALDGFTSLTHLVISTREAFTSALRDDHCHILGQSRALQKLQSLSIQYCDISGQGLKSILRSPHLGPISALNLHVPARAPLLSALAAAPKVLQGLTQLSLAADHLSVPGVKKLVAVREALGHLRTLRIRAAETGGYDWELPFTRHGGGANVRQLAKALCALLPALEGLETLEVAHGAGAPAQVSKKDVLATLTKPKDVIASALPLTMC